ncbi:unnamed protein product [Acanthoscelides obtectus]|uniref:Uncharacterized protein n=1 Tax=Acanthoscelides obtectus TaxID=200917 RepID=A0A9P0KIV5_ACAOB|nr:unnamed protein product [Acanthoscelides obtectus]CAK1633103.1 hypothetical protein AOBTE_LOCUS7952 [Acanthoscelides obtectus]
MSDADQETQEDEDSESTDLPHSQQGDEALPTSGDDGSSTSLSVSSSTVISRVPKTLCKRKKMLTPADEMMQFAGEQLQSIRTSIRTDDEFDAYGNDNILQLPNAPALYLQTLNHDTPEVSNVTLPNVQTNKAEQPNAHQSESQQLNNASAFFSNFSA